MSSSSISPSPPRLPPNGIVGISFDVESTLLSTKGLKTAEHYERAFQKYFFDESNNKKQPQPHQPKWMIQKDSDLRSKTFGKAWSRANQERRKTRNQNDNDEQVDDDETRTNLNILCEAYAGQPFPEVVDEFFFLVVKYFFFFDTDCNDDEEKNIIDDSIIRDFTNYLVHDYWISTEAYSLPTKNPPLLLEIKNKYPDLCLFIVSNTDDRCKKAVRLFPMYAEIFSKDEQFVTATNVEWIVTHHNQEKIPALKPFPHGIFTCMMRCPFYNETKNKWIHVGDDEEADGGAAKNAGCLFLKCDRWEGVDFGKLLEILDS